MRNHLDFQDHDYVDCAFGITVGTIFLALSFIFRYLFFKKLFEFIIYEQIMFRKNTYNFKVLL